MRAKAKPAHTTAGDPIDLADYRPVALRTRADGWTAKRQRKFLTVLAETGCISEACKLSGVSSRSAYRLRQHPGGTAFAAAWDQALRLATVRLTSIAFDRAIKGSVREFWRDGELVGQTRGASDKVLVFLLGHLLPRGDAPSRLDALDTQVAAHRDAFPARLAALVDNDCEMVPLESRDFFAEVPGDMEEDT